MQPLICVDLKKMKLRISHGTENKLAWAPSKVIVKARNYETISLWLDLQTISTPGCLLYRVVGSLYDCCLTLKNGIIQTTEFALFFSQSFQLWAELSPSLITSQPLGHRAARKHVRRSAGHTDRGTKWCWRMGQSLLARAKDLCYWSLQ